MPKKLAIALAAITLTLLLCLGLLLLFINPIVQRLRPQIVSVLSTQLGHPIELEAIEVDLIPSTKLSLQHFRLKDSEDLRVGSLALSTSLLQLIRGEVKIENLELHEAQLVLTRNEAGQLSIGPISLDKKQNTAALEGPQLRTVAAVQSSDTEVPDKDTAVAFAVRSVGLHEVGITFVDHSVTPTQTLELKELEGRVENIAPQTEGSVALRAQFLSAEPANISLEGSILLGGGPAGLPKTDMRMAAVALNLDALEEVAAAYGSSMKSLVLEHTASLSVHVRIDDGGIIVESDGVDFSAAQLAYANAFKKSSGIPLRLQFRARPFLSGDVSAEEVSLQVGTAKLALPFEFKRNGAITAKIQSSEIDLASLSKLVPPLDAINPRGALRPDLAVEIPKREAPKVHGTVAVSNLTATLPAKQGALALESLSGNIVFEGDRLRTEKMQMTVAGQTLQPTLEVQQFKTPKVQYNVAAADLALAPLLKPYGVTTAVVQSAVFKQLQLQGAHNQASKKGSTSMRFASGTLGAAQLGESTLALQYQLDAKNAPSTLVIDPSSFVAFGGRLALDGNIQQGSGLLSLRASNMQLEQLSSIALGASAFRLLGTLQESRFRGRFEQTNIPATLRGEFSAEAVDGELKGFNLLRETFGRMGTIPGLEGSLDKYFPPEHRELLQGDSTKFDTMTLASQIEKQQLQIQTFRLAHSLYELRSTGTANFSGGFDLKAQLVLTAALCEKMVLRQPKLELLLDDKRNMIIPLVLRKQERIVVVPDISDLGKRALKNTAKEAVSKELDKVTPGLGKALEGLFK